jgi:hypothetical protein
MASSRDRDFSNVASALSGLKGTLSAFLDEGDDDDEEEEEILFNGEADEGIRGSEGGDPNLLLQIKHINQTLDIYGYPSLPSSFPSLLLSSSSSYSSGALEVVHSIVNSLSCLLKQRQKDLDCQYEQQEGRRRIESDREVLQTKVVCSLPSFLFFLFHFFSVLFSSSLLFSSHLSFLLGFPEREDHKRRKGLQFFCFSRKVCSSSFFPSPSPSPSSPSHLLFLLHHLRSLDEKFRITRKNWEKEKEELQKQITQLQHKDSQYLVCSPPLSALFSSFSPLFFPLLSSPLLSSPLRIVVPPSSLHPDFHTLMCSTKSERKSANTSVYEFVFKQH